MLGAGGPTAAECLVELDVGGGAVGLDSGDAFLEGEVAALGVEHGGDVDDAGAVFLAGELGGVLGSGGSFLQRGEALRAEAAGDERVLDFGQGC